LRDFSGSERWELAAWASRVAIPVWSTRVPYLLSASEALADVSMLPGELNSEALKVLRITACIDNPTTHGLPATVRERIGVELDRTWFGDRRSMNGTGIPGLIFAQSYNTVLRATYHWAGSVAWDEAEMWPTGPAEFWRDLHGCIQAARALGELRPMPEVSR
jgi:hypothetical protein